MTTPDDQRAAFALLDQAIEACFAIGGPNDGTPVDAVLVIGAQHIEDDGARTGHVEVYPRTGSQPLCSRAVRVHGRAHRHTMR